MMVESLKSSKTMKRKSTILGLLLILSCFLSVQAQKFDYIDTKGNSIHSIFKDSRGILWLGTNDGIMTYAQLLSQTPNGYIRSPFLNGIIVNIQEDKLGRLVLTAQSNKYTIYSPKDNKVIRQVDQYFQKAGIPIKYDFELSVDGKGDYWLGAKQNLYIFDPQTRKHRHIAIPKNGGNIAAIQTTKEKRAIIVCTKNIYLVDAKTYKAQFLCTLPEIYNYQLFYAQEDSKGNIWLASSSRLHRFDIQQHKWKEYPIKMFDINTITLLKDDQLLVPTTNTGVFIFDSQGETHRQLLPSQFTGLINKHILGAYYDRESNNIWLNYHKQGMAVAAYTSHTTHPHTLSPLGKETENDIIALTETADHTLWMGTEDNGAYHLKAAPAGSVAQIDNVLSNSFQGSTVVGLLTDSKGRTWTGLYRFGLHCSDGSSYFQGYSPYSMLESPTGEIYVSLMGLGLWKINPITHQTTQVEDENLWLMQIISKGDMLYTASPKYIHCINMRTGKKKRIPAERFGDSNFGAGCRALCIDRRGWLWIINYASNAETDIYDTKTGKCFTTHALEHYVVNSVVEDRDGNLWFGTTNGIVRLKVEDAKKQHFSTHCYIYGTQRNQYYNERCALRLSDGRLVFGAIDGYMLFDPRQIAQYDPHDNQPSLIFTSLRINSEYINPEETDSKDAICTGDFCYVKELNLKYDENNLVLEFCPRNANRNSFKTYYYKVEGVTRDWMPLSNYQIVLSHLPSGTFHLLLREQPNQQETGSIEYEALTITVHPPFWLSIWAYILYIGIAITLISFIYRYYTHRRRFVMKMKIMHLKAKHEQEMNDMKLQFFTNVSHDLRTPLTLIITPLEELIGKVSDRQMHETLDTMLRNAKRLFFLVNQILDIRALDVKSVKVFKSREDIVALMHKEYESFLSISKMRKMKVSLESNVSQLMMDTDSDKLTKIIENLLSNAFKYTQNEGEIQLRLHYAEEKVEISVADTGTGISDEEKKHIFTPFFMGDNGYKKESSGIGLSIVREFTQQLGGSISVEDNLPQGTIFRITLPCESKNLSIVQTPLREDNSTLLAEHQETPNTQEPEKTPKTSEKLPMDHSKQTLLIVEDNIDLLHYLSETLSQDYNICQATDGQQALDILKAMEINLIISDVMMAGMDGLTLCRKVKQTIETSHIPIILLTAKSLQQDEMIGLQLGANDYITKPFSMEILRLRIKSQLERVSTARQTFKEKAEVNPSEVTITTLDEQLLSDCIAFVEKNIAQVSLSPEDVANGVNLSRTTLYKKLRSITGDTPVAFIRIIRLKRAKQLLEQDRLYVAEVAARVGFNNPKTFARYFHDEFGVYPSEITGRKKE